MVCGKLAGFGGLLPWPPIATFMRINRGPCGTGSPLLLRIWRVCAPSTNQVTELVSQTILQMWKFLLGSLHGVWLENSGDATPVEENVFCHTWVFGCASEDLISHGSISSLPTVGQLQVPRPPFTASLSAVSMLAAWQLAPSSHSAPGHVPRPGLVESTRNSSVPN